MTTTTRKLHHLVTSVLALSFASAGCALSVDPQTEGLDVADVAATEQAWTCSGDCPEGIEATINEVATNEYTIVLRTTLDASAGKVWSRVQNFEKLLKIASGDVFSNFQWVSGSPGHIPAVVQFDLGGQTIVEEVFYRNSHQKVLRYRVVNTPVLGIEDYTAEIALIPCESGTVIEIGRELTLSPDVDIDPFLSLFRQEIITISEYFNGDSLE